ncbi:MAG: DNA-binding response regulator [Campylobacterales bacterium]
MLKIGIVEDEPFTLAFLEQSVSELGHSVAFGCDCEKKAMEKIETLEVDIIFLDINLKGSYEGIWLADEVNKKFQIPFIYITAYRDKKIVEKVSKTKPFYFISKPFDVSDIEIALSIFEVKNLDVEVLELCEHYSFDIKNMVLYRDKEQVNLTKKERELLWLLIENRGLVVPVSKIIDDVWKDKAIGDSAIRDTVYRLRKKIPEFKIENIPSSGYSLSKSC